MHHGYALTLTDAELGDDDDEMVRFAASRMHTRFLYHICGVFVLMFLVFRLKTLFCSVSGIRSVWGVRILHFYDASERREMSVTFRAIG